MLILDVHQVVYGAPGSRLVDQAISPLELVESQGSLRLNATYYITKQVRHSASRTLHPPMTPPLLAYVFPEPIHTYWDYINSPDPRPSCMVPCILHKLLPQRDITNEILVPTHRCPITHLCYHLCQIIPALERVLSLVGADVHAWYAGLPRAVRMLPQKRPGISKATFLREGGRAPPQGPGAPWIPGGPHHMQPSRSRGMTLRQGVIEQHFLSSHCAVCDEQTLLSRPLCPRCTADPRASAAVLMARMARLERQHAHMVRMCLHCGGGGGGHSGADGGGRAATITSTVTEAAAGRVMPSGGEVNGSTGIVGCRDTLAAVASGFCAGAGNIVCESLDCGVYFERRKLAHELGTLSALTQSSCDGLGW